MQQGIYITTQTVITAGAVIGALAAIFGALFTVYKWYLKQEKQDHDITHLKAENALLVYGVSACLDGLMQLGANHTVPIAKEKLDKHINQQAHE